MKELEYAFCVACIRANEKHLLTSADVNKLAESQSYDEALKFLSSKGWIEAKGSINDFVARRNEKLWQLISEIVPDKKELEVLCVVNDYFNLKAAVKCLLTGNDLEKFYIKPTTVDLVQLTENIKNHTFENIGADKGDCVSKAYDIANKTQIGQNAEIIIDKAAIDCMRDFAKKYKNSISGEICAFMCDTSNIKIALRCALTAKNKDFVESAIGECSKLDRADLISYTLSGVDKLKEYLLNTDYSEGASLYDESPSAYDKWCDDQVIEVSKNASFKAFGFDPVCAYYYAVITEIKTVNIILSGLYYGADKNTIKQRVRNLYV